MGSKKSIVLLLGWLGCSERALNKYVNLFDQTSRVISMRPGIPQTALPWIGDPFLLKHVDQFNRAALEHHPHSDVVIAAMSNAGFLALSTSLLLSSLVDLPSYLKNNDENIAILTQFRSIIQQRTRGIIFDSTPSKVTPQIWSKGLISAGLQQSSATVATDNPYLVSIAQIVAKKYLGLPPVHTRLADIQRIWTTVDDCLPKTTVPELFLYSKADALIPHTDVEEFIECQKQLGIPVYSHRWEDSGHCEHLRRHPEEYRQHVLEFVKQIIH